MHQKDTGRIGRPRKFSSKIDGIGVFSGGTEKVFSLVWLNLQAFPYLQPPVLR